MNDDYMTTGLPVSLTRIPMPYYLRLFRLRNAHRFYADTTVATARLTLRFQLATRR